MVFNLNYLSPTPYSSRVFHSTRLFGFFFLEVGPSSGHIVLSLFPYLSESSSLFHICGGLKKNALPGLIYLHTLSLVDRTA